MSAIFDLLEEIERRPSMYVGGDASHRVAQLQSLEMLLFGYSLAVRAHNIDEPVKDFPREFAEYLGRKYAWSAACGPIAAILEVAASDTEAWEMFWRLVKEFRASRGNRGRFPQAGDAIGGNPGFSREAGGGGPRFAERRCDR